jgi:hypothetical protein
MSASVNNVISIVSEKTCTKCGVSKALSEFHVAKKAPSGFQSQCKKCRSMISKSKYNPTINKEKYKLDKEREKITPEFITCKKCDETKEGELFKKACNSITGRLPICKRCDSQQKSLRYHTVEKHKKKVLKYGAARKRLDRYGVTQETFEAIFCAQNGSCAICNVKLDSSEKKFRPFMDHCHSTGKIRGILCSCCNAGIGMLRDSEDLLLNSIKYLSKYKANR